jgi:hypothetical protein
MRFLPVLVMSSFLSSLAAQNDKQPAPDLVPGSVPAASYAWVKGWGVLEGGKDLGNTHGCLVVDKDGNVLANTDTEHAVMTFSAEGKLLRAWGKEFQGGLHGMCLRDEGGEQVLYLAHTRRHEIVKTKLDGTVLWTLGWPEASGIYQNEGQYNPTAVAVGPDGRIFAADGYGRSWIHLYDQDRKYVKSFGGPGNDAGKLQTPHGIWLDGRGKEPLLLVCDRENHRLQWFTMDGAHVRTMDKDLRRPCNVAPLPNGGIVVADLAGRITLLDKDDKLVCHLGDNPEPGMRAQNGVPRDKWQDGVFLSPHGVCVDKAGAIYVQDWNFLGRVSKLVPVAAPASSGGAK